MRDRFTPTATARFKDHVAVAFLGHPLTGLTTDDGVYMWQGWSSRKACACSHVRRAGDVYSLARCPSFHPETPRSTFGVPVHSERPESSLRTLRTIGSMATKDAKRAAIGWRVLPPSFSSGGAKGMSKNGSEAVNF